MLLINPPIAKPSEPPAGIARIAGALRSHGVACACEDLSLHALLFLLEQPADPHDTWSKRACRNVQANLAALRGRDTYQNFSRYQRAVTDVNKVLELAGQETEVSINLANYSDPHSSPLKSADLLECARQPQKNIFYPFFSTRLAERIAQASPRMIGLSLNYLSQANTTFAIIGFLKQAYPTTPIVLGGGLVTSWLSRPDWQNPFSDLVDHCISGPGEIPLLKLFGIECIQESSCPDYTDFPAGRYLSPGFILPYAASSGCYWNRCSFCPEKAEKNPYQQIPPRTAVQEISELVSRTSPVLLHLLDNAVSPGLMQALIDQPPGVDWYGFARVHSQLTDEDFCRALRSSGCRMLKLGLESGDQGVLDRMEKGIDLRQVSQSLNALHKAGIGTYVYLLFGTPAEAPEDARKTLDFVVRHHHAIGFLNLAIFNMPLGSPEAKAFEARHFYAGDLSLYTDFVHPKGWDRKSIRHFLDKEFKRHPAIAPILQRDPPFFTSNHAAFFV